MTERKRVLKLAGCNYQIVLLGRLSTASVEHGFVGAVTAEEGYCMERPQIYAHILFLALSIVCGSLKAF